MIIYTKENKKSECVVIQFHDDYQFRGISIDMIKHPGLVTWSYCIKSLVIYDYDIGHE